MILVGVAYLARGTERSGLKGAGIVVITKQEICHLIARAAQTCRIRAGGAIVQDGVVVVGKVPQVIRGKVTLLNPLAEVKSYGQGVLAANRRNRISELPHRYVTGSAVIALTAISRVRDSGMKSSAINESAAGMSW